MRERGGGDGGREREIEREREGVSVCACIFNKVLLDVILSVSCSYGPFD